MTAQPAEGPWQEPPPAVNELDDLVAQTLAPVCPVRAAYWGTVLLLDHLFAAVARTDRRTGRRLPQSLHQTLLDLAAVLRRGVRPVPEDVVLRAAALCHTPLTVLLTRPRQRLRRTHMPQPAHKVRELDTRSMAWLAHRPGRTTREKIGTARHVLGVTRLLIPDTVENRVARRLLDDLTDCIRRRLACAAAYDSHTDESRQRLELLREVQRVCVEGLAKSPLVVVAAAVGVVRPNHVLLCDPVYSRVWRAWKWLRGQEAELERQWRTGPERLVLTVFWLLAARLCDWAPVLLPDAFCRIEGGPDGAGFGLGQLGPAGAWQPQGSPPRLRLLCKAGATATLLDFRIDGDRVCIERSTLAGTGVVRPRKTETWEVEIQFAPEQPCRSGRYLPFTARVRRDGQTFQVIEDMADLQGFRHLTDRFYHCLLGPRGAVTGTVELADEGGGPVLLGIDAASAWPRAVTERGQGLVPLDLRLCAMQITFADATADWLDGRESRTLSPWSENCRTIPAGAALGGPRTATRGLALAVVQRTMTALASALRPAPHAALAFAVPDSLDELAQRDLRAAVAPAFGKLWLIPRGVAGALGWQTLVSFQGVDLQEGDSLVVLDAEAAVLTATWLTARHDARLDGAPARGFYWERRSLAASEQRQVHLTYRDLLADYCRRAAQGLPLQTLGLSPAQERRLLDHLLDTGDAERLVEQEVPVWLPLPPESTAPEAWLHLTVDRQARAAAGEAWLAEFVKLLRGWNGRGPFQDIRAHQRASAQPETAARPLHVLLLGRPCHDAWLRQEVRQALQRLAPGRLGVQSVVEVEHAEELVARGTRAFLERHAAGLPTWEDWLPDLYLETVTGEGAPRFVPLVKDRRARPGDQIVYDVELTEPTDAVDRKEKEELKLPAGAERYLFPLLRDPNGSFEAFYDARLESSAFPLSRDTPVALQVNYRYGEDSFRLVVLPKDGAASFAPIVVQWVPGDEERPLAAADRWNEVPPFPRPNPDSWDVPVLAGEVRLLRQAAEHVDFQAEGLFAAGDAGRLSVGWLARDLDALGKTIQSKLQPACTRLWVADRDRAPGEILDLLDSKVFPWLEALADPASAELPASWRRPAEAAVREALARLRGDALAVLSGLRSDAPPWVAEVLLSDARLPRGGRFARMLGRALGDGEGERVPVVQQLINWARSGLERLEGLQDGGINRPLTALDAALWGHSGFVWTLARLGHVPFLLSVVETACKELCERLPHEVSQLGEDRHFWKRLLYQQASEILLGLLRLRGQESGRLFAAGSRRMVRLARQIRRIDSLFRQAGMACRSCVRFQESDLGGRRTSLSPCAYVLTSYSLGESVPPAILIDTESGAAEDDLDS